MSLFSKRKDESPFIPVEDSIEKNEVKLNAPHVLTVNEVLGKEDNTHHNNSGVSALDLLKKRIDAIAEQKGDTITEEKAYTEIPLTEEITEMPVIEKENTETEQVADQKDETKSSLLDKCKPYMIDENGEDASLDSKPLYKLQSVAEILKSNTDKSLESLSKKYEFTFDDLGYNKTVSPKENSDIQTTEPEIKATVKEIIEEKDIPKEENPTPEIFEEKISFKNMQSNVSSIISDIDNSSFPSANKQKNKDIGNTATITFTPINSGAALGQGISVSSKTKPIDLTGELLKLPQTAEENDDAVQLEKNDFEEYTPKSEFSSPKDIAKFIRLFSIKKRRAFLATFFSFFLTVLMSCVKLPFMSELLLSYTTVSMIICASVSFIIVLLNVDMFKSLAKILKRQATADICTSLASLTTLIYAVLGIINQSIISDMLLLLDFILCFRALSKFHKSAYTLSNFKQISTPLQKQALKLVNDPAITFSMAKNAVDGDALIAVPQKTNFVADYMKYSEYGVFLGGKLNVITILSLLTSLILGIACTYYFDGIVYGMYAAAALQCFTSLPAIFFIENLPLYSASKKLNKKGAMIAGKTGAEYIEMANAVVFSSADLFPAGTVTLHQMKILSENNLDDTIIRAASLTESLNSPLAPIFKKIAGTSDIAVLPDSDTVKYEDKMGISGWVDNRLLFIGNRTLMEAHSIEVPPIDVDRKILRNGYFPVYVATRDRACALLIIQYEADREISHELRKLSSLGVTMLINSCDPNLTEEMICDYLGLYSDSVKVMSAAGCHMYKNSVAPVNSVSAPAAFKYSPITLASIINCASKIKRSNVLLTVMYIILLVLGSVIFAYSSLTGSGELISETTVLLYGIISTVVSYLIYLTERP